MIISFDLQSSPPSAATDNLADMDRAVWAGEQHRRCQAVLQAIAQVEIVVDAAGLQLMAPSGEVWEADDDYAEDFLQLPIDFAKSYLRLRLRNFLYETFCLAPIVADRGEAADDQTLLANDRVGGDLHVGLLKQFSQSNHGKGYLDPGWQVVEVIEGDTLAVQKHGVVVHVERSRHLQLSDRAAQMGDTVAIYLPGYRFEPGCYVAVGDRGPVEDLTQAVDIYFAANAAAMAPIMAVITTALNSEEAIYYTLQVPYEPEGYEGPEAMILRVESTAYAKVRPVLQQIWQIAQTTAAPASDQADFDPLDLASPPRLRPELPVFAYPLWPGISVAAVIESTVTRWYGGSADLSRIQLAADALAQLWHQKMAENSMLTESSSEPSSEPFSQPSVAENLAAMQAQFAQAQLSWQEPYRFLNGREGDWFE